MKHEENAYDAIVVGAGFAGLYQLLKLRGTGMRVLALEAGSDIGGTWFWNRYPGARCDVESLDYSYSFDDRLQQEWNWSERYATQPEILRYIHHVADRYDLRKDIRLSTRVSSAVFDEAVQTWKVGTVCGDEFTARFVILATGALSIPQKPQIPGIDNFAGEWHHSADWPEGGVDFKGKRVGLIGTGSSGVQMAPIIAAEAAHLTVLQRTANFSVPAQNEPFTAEALAKAKSTYSERRAAARAAPTGHYNIPNDKSAVATPKEERDAEFEWRWKGAGGGFRMLRAFNDLLVNPESNRLAGDFVRDKIRKIVKDPAKAEALCPKDDVPFGAKRLCVDSGYYETFNRDNVDLVDIHSDPIEEVRAGGITLRSGRELAFDVLVFATGFDALTGAVRSIDIRGRGNESLASRWEAGPTTYLGLAVSGFPNLFLLAGPGSPSVLSNVVHSIEVHVDWVTALIEHMRKAGKMLVEAGMDEEAEWVRHVNELAGRTLYPKGNSWYLGANIPGKPRVFMPYVGGVPAYRAKLESVAADGYRGFTLT